MKQLAAIAALCLTATSAIAEWPATRFIPIPTVAGDHEAEIDNNLSGAGDGGWRPTISGSVMSFETLDLQQLRRGAIGALTDIMNQAAIDARILSNQGFRAPLIDPRVDVTSTGDSYYGIFWEDPTAWVDPNDRNYATKVQNEAPMHRGCINFNPRTQIRIGNKVYGINTFRQTIAVNNWKLPYNYLNEKWRSGGFDRERTIAYMSATLIHEVVHAIQAAGMNANCANAPKWLEEATADGIAYYLLSKRKDDVFNRFDFARNDRRWDAPLDPGGVTASGTSPTYRYATGSFIRYLLEASESGGNPDMRILRQILSTPNAQVRSRAGVLSTIDLAIENFTGDRDLYRVFPEFLTEMASYGGSRYRVSHRGMASMATGASQAVPLDIHRWMKDRFRDCVEYSIQPGEAIPDTVEVRQLAGECVKVSWSGFTNPVALQFYAETTDDRQAHLHLGEAYRSDPNGVKRCYDDVTSKLGRRISMKMARKCILRRASHEVSGGGAPDSDTGLWTSDFNLVGEGFAYFVVTNIAKDPIETEDITFNLIVGALDVKSNGQNDMEPRDTSSSKPVRGGRTNINKRLHTMQAAGDRMLFDGRSIIGSSIGLGFFEGLPGMGNTGDGVMTIVRGGNYWVMFIGVGPNNIASASDGAMIIKNPGALERGNPMGALFSGGMIGQGQPLKCGREVLSKVTLIEQTPEKLVFRIQGDLFDMKRAMMAGATNDACLVLNAAFVERADFTVSLPYGRMYDGDSKISRSTPPGQEVYDDLEYLSGPVFGGIETGMSLASFGSGPDPEPESDTGGTGGASSASSSGGVVSENCTCSCPDSAVPATAICKAQCRPTFAACSPSTSTETTEAPADAFERILRNSGYPAEAQRLLLDDFRRMSPDTQAYIVQNQGR